MLYVALTEDTIIPPKNALDREILAGLISDPMPYGFLWIDTKAFPEPFAQGVDSVRAKVLATVQKPPNASIFDDKISRAALGDQSPLGALFLGTAG